MVIKVLDPDPGLFRRKRSSGVCEAGYGLAIEDRFPVGAEGFEKDVFDGQGVLVVRVGLATDLGLADVDPVGGTKAGVAEARGFAEGFQHSWVQVIAAVQVGGQAAFDLGEQVRGEVRDPDPGQDGRTIPTLGMRRSPSITSSIRWPGSGWSAWGAAPCAATRTWLLPTGKGSAITVLCG